MRKHHWRRSKMSIKAVDIDETSPSVAELLDLLHEDTEILLTKGNIPLARLSAIEAAPAVLKPRVPGLHAGTTWISDDFDDPLPDEFWLGES
jgi:antitoxin (DNA-binding transcriptional repressor) of toxin-antitoxin stability system